ncbi:MAG: helix-turn-helix domain-containing protein [Synechococcaceae cyanobacterium]|nr:helix-turn-helix domain-containing protein [Synechococcaceae cyanobacterium]
MAASRLSDGQKAEIVERYRQGAGSVELADTYGCSPNTVSRVLKAGLDPAEYERLKRRRVGRPGSVAAADLTLPPVSHPVAVATPAPEASGDGDLAPPLLPPESGGASPDVDPSSGMPDPRPEDLSAVQEQVELPLSTVPALSLEPQARGSRLVGRSRPEEEDEEPGLLAIEDAEDFGEDDEDDDELMDDGDDPPESPTLVTPLPLAPGLDPLSAAVPLPWGTPSLPDSAYLLVEKVVELQPQQLQELTELGPLPEGERQRKALVLYVNPRQAKRQCGRNQRVIRIPDTGIIGLTAGKLLAQGITRVVVEGSLYALPGS